MKYGQPYQTFSCPISSFSSENGYSVAKIPLGELKQGSYSINKIVMVLQDDKQTVLNVDYYPFEIEPLIIPAEIQAISSVTPELNNSMKEVDSTVIFNMTCDDEIQPNIYLYYANADSDKKLVVYETDMQFKKKIDDKHYEFSFQCNPEFAGFKNFQFIALELSGISNDLQTSYKSKFYSPANISLDEYEKMMVI